METDLPVRGLGFEVWCDFTNLECHQVLLFFKAPAPEREYKHDFDVKDIELRGQSHVAQLAPRLSHYIELRRPRVTQQRQPKRSGENILREDQSCLRLCVPIRHSTHLRSWPWRLPRKTTHTS